MTTASLVYINPAEAILEPFWDMSISRIDQWECESGTVKQSWCGVDYSWQTAPMTLHRPCRIDSSDFNALTLSIILPRKTTLEISVDGDKGVISSFYPPEERDPLQTEFRFPLRGTTKINGISLIFHSDVPDSGWMRWIGFENTPRLKEWLAYWDKVRHHNWDQHLAKPGFTPSFTPSMGIVLTGKQLDSLREYHDAYLKKHGSSPFTTFAERVRNATPPELRIMETASQELRFARYRDVMFWKEHGSLTMSRLIAITGTILRDKELLSLAARYALSLTACDKWGTGFQAHVRGTSFDHRSFDESGIAWNIVAALDLAGDALSDSGKTLLLRHLAERGIGQINYVVWRYPYIFKNNQLAAFSPGRIAGYLALEKNWAHVQPYTDLAKQELDSSFNSIFAADGGFSEGSAYFQYTMGTGLPAYFMFANGRNQEFTAIIPQAIAKADSYADVFISTCEDQYFIPISSCNGKHGLNISAVSLLAKIFPASQYPRLIRRFISNKKGLFDSADEFFWLAAASSVGQPDTPYKSFAILPSINSVASTRELKSQLVKLLVCGDTSSMRGHRHNDAGAFVLEFAGETFAMDSGSVQYADPWTEKLKSPARHNTLTPMNIPHDATAQTKYVDTPLTAKGDNQSFHAGIDLTPAWKNSFASYRRTWDSPSPDLIVIHDDYELSSGDSVAFNWLTMLPMSQENGRVTVQGVRGRAVIDIQEDAVAVIEKLEYPDKSSGQNRLRIIRKHPKGRLSTRIRLESNSAD